MDKNSFLELKIEDKVRFINERLGSGVTVNQVRQDLGVSKKLLQKILKQEGYKFNQKDKQYKKITGESENYNSGNIVVISKDNYKGNGTVVIDNNEYAILSRKVEEMYEWFELQSKVVEISELKIPINNNKAVSRSFKIYEDVLEEFTNYCRKHSNYKVQDIITLALSDLMKNYK